MLDVIALILITLAVGFWYVRIRLTYWTRRQISHERPTFPWGNMKGFRTKKHMVDILTPLYNRFKITAAPFAGFYLMMRPVVLVLDVELAKEILIRDFANFEDRGMFHNERDDPLTGHLFRIDGPKWKPLRQKLSSTFTSGKMKYMFPTVSAVGVELATICGQLSDNAICGIVEIGDIASRYTSDVIGTCAFGLDCNGLRNPDAEFAVMGRRAFTDRRHNRYIDAFIESYPTWARRLRFCQIHKDITNFYTRIVADTIKEREEKGIKRNDFMNLLIEMKQRNELSMQEITAQAFIFFAAGFDTSASTLTFALYELAKHPHIQNRLREEIQEALNLYEGQFTYDCMQELRYMELVIAGERIHSFLSQYIIVIFSSLFSFMLQRPFASIPLCHIFLGSLSICMWSTEIDTFLLNPDRWSLFLYMPFITIRNSIQNLKNLYRNVSWQRNYQRVQPALGCPLGMDPAIVLA